MLSCDWGDSMSFTPLHPPLFVTCSCMRVCVCVCVCVCCICRVKQVACLSCLLFVESPRYRACSIAGGVSECLLYIESPLYRACSIAGGVSESLLYIESAP